MSIFLRPFLLFLSFLLSFVPAVLTEIWYVHADGELDSYDICYMHSDMRRVCPYTGVNPVDDAWTRC